MCKATNLPLLVQFYFKWLRNDIKYLIRSFKPFEIIFRMGGGYGGRPNKSLFVRNIADDIDRGKICSTS